jgi:tetratricopeptide (TPR) repeat protein
LNALAAVHRSLDNLTDSLRSFQRAHEIWERLASAYPQRNEYRLSLASTCRYLGAIKHRLGDLAAAESLHARSCQLVDELARSGFDRRKLPAYQALCYSEFARFKASISQTDEALKLYQAAIPLLREIVAQQPTNFLRRNSLSRLCLDYAQLAQQSGRLSDAQQACEEAVLLAQRLLAAKPGDQQRQRLLATCTAERDRIRHLSRVGSP